MKGINEYIDNTKTHVETIHELSLQVLRKGFFFAIVLFNTISLYSADILVVAVSKSGEAFYQRGEKESSFTKGQVFERKDKILTKNGIVDLQVGTNSIIRIGKFSTLSLSEIFEEKGKTKVEMNLKSGSLLAKVVKKLDKGSEFKVITPTKTAGVRGTQFLIQEGEEVDVEKESEKIEDGIYVKEGAVEVKPDYLKTAITINAGEELLTSHKALKIQVLDSFVSERLRILDSLNVMRDVNFKNLQKQNRKNKDLLKK